jgi:membrane-bound metal-dependent hydrolase YbcI (DUF457 family)
VPDADGYGMAIDSYTYLAQHRGYGHALITAPLLALACVLLCRAVIGTRVQWSTWLFSLIAVLGHDVLDWTNPYGVRWLLPWSGEWFHSSTILPWDPVILGIAVFTAAMPALLRLIDAWMLNVRMARPGAGWTWLALAALLAYGGVRWSTQARAVRMMGSGSYRNLEPTEMKAYPVRSSLTAWRGLVSVDGAMYELPVDTTTEFPYATRFRFEAPDPEVANLIAAARTSNAVQAVEALGPVVFWVVRAQAGVSEVRMVDARFGTLAEPDLEAVVRVRPDGKVMTEKLIVGSDVY